MTRQLDDGGWSCRGGRCFPGVGGCESLSPPPLFGQRCECTAWHCGWESPAADFPRQGGRQGGLHPHGSPRPRAAPGGPTPGPGPATRAPPGGRLGAANGCRAPRRSEEALGPLGDVGGRLPVGNGRRRPPPPPPAAAGPAAGTPRRYRPGRWGASRFRPATRGTSGRCRGDGVEPRAAPSPLGAALFPVSALLGASGVDFEGFP